MNSFVTDTILLKKFMVDKKMERINELSRLAGVNRKTLGEVLSGKIQPSAPVMNCLVQTLDIPAETAGQIFFSRNLRNE